jgi:hypothetical protein
LFCDMTPFDYALGMFHNDAIIEIAGPTYCLLDHFSTRLDGSIASVRYCKPKSGSGRSHK